MKMKTNKSVSKRIRKTGKGKLMKKTAGQCHFNAKESSKITRNKRKQKQLPKSLKKIADTYTPYK